MWDRVAEAERYPFMMDRLFRLEKHEGWGVARVFWALAMLITWAQRGLYFPERYTDAGAVLRRTYIPVTDYYYFSPGTGWLAYSLLIAALLLVAFRRFTRTALVVSLVIHMMLCFTEGLNFKGYDRLMMWQGIALFFAPGAIDGRAEGLPLGRYLVAITYMGLYGQTGWEKIANEPTWWEGLPLMYNMVHRNFGDMFLGVLISDWKWLMIPMSWITVVFEAGFPLFFLVRKLRPWLLLVGVAFHLGILILMNVPNFTTASLALYPVLLMPDEYRRFRDRCLPLWGRLQRQQGAEA